jgi:hypothetical protein
MPRLDYPLDDLDAIRHRLDELDAERRYLRRLLMALTHRAALARECSPPAPAPEGGDDAPR